MNTFTKYGDEYPFDSMYAQTMADYMITPLYDELSQVEWNMYRDFAITKDMSIEDMFAFMVSKDNGVHNLILGHSPQSLADLQTVYNAQFNQ